MSEEIKKDDNGENKRSRKRIIWITPIILVILLIAIIFLGDWKYAYKPPLSNILNQERGNTEQTFDYWGVYLSKPQSDSLLQTELGHRMLTPANGAVQINEEKLELGRNVFYKETFNNEYFFTDILGGLNGPVNFWSFARALISLRGRGTDNLQIRAVDGAVVGGRIINSGDLINTGLDVAKGAYVPVGMKVRFKKGKPMIGFTCAACHSSYDSTSEMIIEGAPNNNLNAGLLLAMGTNSASYFANTDIDDIQQFISENSSQVMGSDGKLYDLPDADSLEYAVDSTLTWWPPGSYDAFPDTRSTPTRIPDTFTFGDHPYGWTGFSMVGPFKGMSVMNNYMHGLNADKFADTEALHRLYGIDREQYVGTLLQNAANEDYRFNPLNQNETPTEFLVGVKPNEESPIFNNAFSLPSYPRASFVSPNGLWFGTNDYRVWEEINALSVFQNSLIPPPPHEDFSTSRIIHGRQVFLDAGCQNCHSGPAFTNNQVLSTEDVGTEPMRARAFEEIDDILVPPTGYPFNAKIPVLSGTRTIDIPLDLIDQEQVNLAWAIADSVGGYKVKSLIGLNWSPPFLHDGGISVGADPNTQLGLSGTLFRGIPADPGESLRALIDRDLRERVLQSNQSMPELAEYNVNGVGHEYWVDQENGFSQKQQENLIHYLLHIERDEEN